MADVDRETLSQYASETLGLNVAVGGVASDVDNNLINVTISNQDSGGTVFTRTATRSGVGVYEVDLSPADTANLGNYIATWVYSIAGNQKAFNSYFVIGGAQPHYDNLTDALKMVVDSVWMRFADLFDSPNGGPNLSTYYQTNWGRGRIAQLLRIAVGRLNTVAQPYSTYSIDPGGPAFPTDKWGALLEQALYVEALKHLRRSYVEQPDYQGSTISRLDRRDYMQRWGEVLADEEALLRPQLDHFKIRQMGLGRPAVLVSGGVFGRYNGFNRWSSSMIARPHYWFAGS